MIERRTFELRDQVSFGNQEKYNATQKGYEYRTSKQLSILMSEKKMNMLVSCDTSNVPE